MIEGADDIAALATRIVQTAIQYNLTIATAESCTGGRIGAVITDIPGASDAFDRGFITYSNASKIDHLGVDPESIAEFGAVSECVAREMALGALSASGADIGIAVTGIAGPGGSDHKPAGLVWFGLATKSGRLETLEQNYGDIGRDAVRTAAVRQALALLMSGLQGS
ncbi:MAG: competence damage-inducible protein A [Hyphobacterium sp.]|nr:MAG: competence damage-inducible protein A [Hyphobacterium sp.]